MGKENNKKGKQHVGDPAAAQPAEDFDDMLAELQALDLVTGSPDITGNTTTSTTSTATIPLASSASGSSSSAQVKESPPTGPPPNMASEAKEKINVSDETVAAACERGDVRQLRKGAGRVSASAIQNI
jgi:hypothetical protein